MKPYKFFIFLVVIFSCITSKSNASRFKNSPLKQATDSATVIVEGTVVKYTVFKGSDNKSYISNTVHVSNVFKSPDGAFACGYIQIITLAGVSPDKSDSSGIWFFVGENGIFMCKPTSRPSLSMPDVHPYKLEIYSDWHGFIEYPQTQNDPKVFCSYGSTHFQSKQALYDTLIFVAGLQRIPCDYWANQGFNTEISRVDYIFEGRYLSSKCFKSDGYHNVYTSSLYEINKVFKGNLKCGKVEIISAGGTVGRDITMVEDGPSMSSIGIIMTYSSSVPSFMHLKNNPVPLVAENMIEYRHDWLKHSYSYFSFFFPNRQAIYDTLVRVIGHRYASCGDSVSREFNEADKKGMPIPISEMLAHNPYVFEGKLLSSTSFRENDNSAQIYTSKMYRIKKIFRGNLQCGKVEIIEKGGKIGDDKTVIPGQPLMTEEGIIIAKATTYPSLNHLTTNTTALTCDSMIKYNYWDINNHVMLDYTNLQPVFDTITKIIGLDYMSCENYPYPEACPKEPVKIYTVEDTVRHVARKAPLEVTFIKAYLNQNQDTLDIEVPNEIRFGNLYLYDDNSNLVLLKPIPLHMDLHHIDISGLKTGHYLGTIEQGTRVVNFQFTKE